VPHRVGATIWFYNSNKYKIIISKLIMAAEMNFLVKYCNAGVGVGEYLGKVGSRPAGFPGLLHPGRHSKRVTHHNTRNR
jgi:hypothetical protein